MIKSKAAVSLRTAAFDALMGLKTITWLLSS